MPYYHVNQGLLKDEPMLALMAADPVNAARGFFHYWAMNEALIIWPMSGDNASAALKVGQDDWSDALFLGCFVENRKTGEVWSVSTNEDGTPKSMLSATLVEKPSNKKKKPATKARKK